MKQMMRLPQSRKFRRTKDRRYVGIEVVVGLELVAILGVKLSHHFVVVVLVVLTVLGLEALLH